MSFSNRIFISIIFIFLSNSVSSQSFVIESFEQSFFPPTGWVAVNVMGSQQWKKVTNPYHSGTACAMIDYESTNGEDWLISPKYLIHPGDSLSFFLRLNYVGWIPDTLAIRVSTTDSNLTSFTNLILLLQEGVNYPSGGVWQKYSVSLNSFAGQHAFIAFRHGDGNGDGIYLDDVFIGAVPPNDVGTSSIAINNTDVYQSQIPHATVINNGTTVQTFNTTMKIGSTYTSVQTVTALQPGQTANVNFASWIPTVGGIKDVTVFTQLNPDAYNANDTMKTTVYVQGVLENDGWISKLLIPKSLIGAGTAFYLDGNLPTDTGYIYVIGGNDFNANSSSVIRFNTITSVWDSVAPVPAGRLLASAVSVNKKIYYIGGYDPAFNPQNKIYIYDPVINTWSAGSNMITAVGDYAVGVYRDSLIYIIGGWAGMADINNVQIYNTYNNTWTSGSPKAGPVVDGLRGGISGNNIIVSGGTNQSSGITVPLTYIGKINPLNPSDIIWTTGPDYPFGAVTRAASGISYAGNHSMVLFTGGEINGSTSNAYPSTCAYDFDIDSWVIGPDKITPVNIVCDFPGIIKNDTLYNIMVTGFDGVNKNPAHEWLNLGSSGIVVSTNDNNNTFKTIDLRQNYPNPFIESTIIPYFISQSTPVSIDVTNQFGQIVYQFQEMNPTLGYHELKVDFAKFSSGIYYYSLVTRGYSKTLKMIKIK